MTVQTDEIIPGTQSSFRGHGAAQMSFLASRMLGAIQSTMPLGTTRLKPYCC